MDKKQLTKLRKAFNNNADSVELNSIYEDIKKEDLLQEAKSLTKEQREDRNVDHDDYEDDLAAKGFFSGKKDGRVMTLDEAIKNVDRRLKFEVKKCPKN